MPSRRACLRSFPTSKSSHSGPTRTNFPTFNTKGSSFFKLFYVSHAVRPNRAEKQSTDCHNEGEQTVNVTGGFIGLNSVRWVHVLVLVLVEIVVEIVERLVTQVPVQVDGI